jgi:molecular chaperone Hsp33
MNDKDVLQRFLFENAPVRGGLVHLSQSYQTIIQQHLYPSVLRHLLGEALAAVCLLASIIKFKGRLTLQFRGKGKLRLLVAQCNQQFQLRALAQWEGELSLQELQDSLRQGILAIMMDSEVSGGKRYQGVVAWQGNSLAQSIEGYFSQSEQLSTRIWLAANETCAGGLLLQVMPKEKPELYKNDWDHLVLLTEIITSHELLHLDNPTLLHRLYSQEDVRLFEQIPVIFQCDCSIARGENAILLLGREEAEQELKDKQRLIVTCEFCNREFVFDTVDVARIFKKGENPPSSTQIH